MEERQSNRGLLILAWAWAAAVTAYMAYSGLTYTGLYKWLADFQIGKWGQYYTAMTGLVPWFLLAGPALSYAGKQERIKAAQAGPAAIADKEKRVAKWVAIIGMACIIVGFASYSLSQRVPDGSEPATPLDIAALDTAGPPETKISIRGEIDPDVSSAIQEKSSNIDINTGYVGFRPDGSDKKAPVRFFIQRGLGNSADAELVVQSFLPEQEGYLIKDGLPPLVLSDFEKRGITIASPHYLLNPGSNTRRDNYYIVAALGGFIGFVCLLVAAASAIRIARKKA